MTQPGVQPVYHRIFQFSVEIQGLQQAHFQEVSGLDATIDVAEYSPGGLLYNTKHHGKVKHSNLVCKRGFSVDAQLWLWFEDVMTGRKQDSDIRKEISVLHLDMSGQEVFRWNLFNAFPVKYTMPSFNGKGNDLAIETIEFAYERVERA